VLFTGVGLVIIATVALSISDLLLIPLDRRHPVFVLLLYAAAGFGGLLGLGLGVAAGIGLRSLLSLLRHHPGRVLAGARPAVRLYGLSLAGYALALILFVLLAR
jgi:hypothetical protein